MFAKRPQHVAFTFLISATVVLALAASSSAQHVQHRDHASLKRLIKKRAPAVDGFPLPVGGAAAAPPSSSTSATASSSSAAASASSAASTTSQTRSATSLASSATPSSSDSSSASNTGTSTSTEAATSATSTSTSSTASNASTTSTSETINVTGVPQAVTPTVRPTVTFTASVEPSATESGASLQQTGAAKTKSTTLTVLIVVASSIAGITILWTVFRKWKLGRSSKFDERLNPIDFQPTSAADGAIPGAHRRHSGASFHSGSGHGHSGPQGFSNDLPDHDFTAGPATLAPVGGYADLARGSSPQPQMHQVNYGAPMNSRYDVGVPLHHQGYASQEAYYDPSGRRY